MAVLFAWNQRPKDKISYENLRLATELPDPELRRTLWVSYYFTRMHYCNFQCQNLNDVCQFINVYWQLVWENYSSKNVSNPDKVTSLNVNIRYFE